MVVTPELSVVLKVAELNLIRAAEVVTLILMESVSDSAPPLPVLPRSLVLICNDAAPLKSCVGVNVRPFKALLMDVIVPLKIIDASDVPSPAEKERPAMLLKLIVPLVAVRVVRTGFAPASTSAIEI